MIFSQRIVSYFIDRCRDRGVVNWGPFAGAPATEDSLAHCWMRLLGVYEFYLHPAVEAALLAKPPRGCGCWGFEWVLFDRYGVSFAGIAAFRI
jgi:hypothetical protein